MVSPSVSSNAPPSAKSATAKKGDRKEDLSKAGASAFRQILGAAMRPCHQKSVEIENSLARRPPTAREAPRETESGREPLESFSEARPRLIAEGSTGLLGVSGMGGSTPRLPSEMDVQLQAVQEVRWELDANGIRTGVLLRVEQVSLSCSIELRSKDGEINLAAIQSDGSELPRELRERIENRLRQAGLQSRGLRVY